MIIRFGYCPPNPGPKAKLKNSGFSDINDAINSYDGKSSIWVKTSGRFREITYDKLMYIYEQNKK